MCHVKIRESGDPMQSVVTRIKAKLRHSQESHDANDHAKIKPRNCSKAVISDGVAGAQCPNETRHSLIEKHVQIRVAVALEVHEVAGMGVSHQQVDPQNGLEN